MNYDMCKAKEQTRECRTSSRLSNAAVKQQVSVLTQCSSDVRAHIFVEVNFTFGGDS